MVKQLTCLLLFFVSSIGLAQNLSLGLGGRANRSNVAFEDQFNFDILTNSGDTLLLATQEVTLQNKLSFPIYARFTSKKKWWLQVNYGYETWRLGVNAITTPTAYDIEGNVNERLAESWKYYTGTLDSIAFRNAFYDVYENDEQSNSELGLAGFERVQYNKLSISFGSILNQKGAIKFYYGLGIDMITTSTFESYQGLVFESPEVSLQNEVLNALPKLNSTSFAPFFNFGLEKQNLRIGLDFTFLSSPAFGGHVPAKNSITLENDNSSQLVTRITSFGVHLNYTLFNQNFNQSISKDKKSNLDPVVIGRYKQKPKLIQFGLAVNIPSIHNSGWSVLEGYDLAADNGEINTNLQNAGDGFITGLYINDDELSDYIYIEKEDVDVTVNSFGELDTNYIFTTIFFNSGNINSIIRSPKIGGFIRFNPHENWALDLNVGYQNQTYGITAYETEDLFVNNDWFSRTRKLLYQENFHEFSVGLNAYLIKSINNISKLGVHLGLNANHWIPGLFRSEFGGINDSELLEDFHEYFIDNDEADEWNKNVNADADKGVFSKADYYNYNYEPSSEAAQQESYHSDFSSYLLNTRKRRSFYELRFGVDYYIENLKFSVYAERSVWRKRSLYNDLLSVGMSVSMFLN